MAKKSKSLAEQLERLDQIQTILENGSAPIEEMLKLYEEGMNLAKESKEYLTKAELQVVEIGKTEA